MARTRVSKFTYGSFCDILYDPNDPDHQSRSHKFFTGVSGDMVLRGSFDIILPKVSCLILSSKYSIIFFKLQVSETKEFRRTYLLFSGSADFRVVYDSVRGNVLTPIWEDVDASATLLTIVYLASLYELISCR
jgi:hypothetical protein